MSIRMEGFKELGQALDQLPKATARNTLRRVLKKAAEPVRDAMADKAPVLTGRLKQSIVVGTKLTSRQARDAKREGKHFAEVHVGTADPAGVVQEYGSFKEPAQPFARPAWDATSTDALVTISTELGAEIEKAAARLAKKLAKAG